jgi:long-subunit fatty acid transport protein
VRRAAAVPALVLLLTSAAAAQDISLNRPGSGARAAGMGNAFIAVSDDGTAASWNPAGLAQLRKPELSLVHTTSQRRLSLEGFMTRDGSGAFGALASSSRSADIEFASLAVPFSVARRPVTLQLGWRRLYQLESQTQGDVRRVPLLPTGRPASLVRIDERTDGSVDLWSLAGAVRVTSRLSLGWSFDFYDGSWEEHENTSEDPGVQGPTDFDSVVFSNSISGQTINLGLLLAYPAFRVGFVYHGALDGSYAAQQSIRSNLTGPLELSLAPGARMHFPRSYGLGVAWLPAPPWRLAFDLTFDEWKDFLLLGIPGRPDEQVNGFDGLPPDLSATRNTVTLNAGLERLFRVKGAFVPLRLGAAYEPQGGRDPLLRDDLNHVILAAGTGVNTNSFKFDVSVEYRFGSYRMSSDITPVYLLDRAADFGLPPAPEAQGSVGLHEWRVKVSLIYRVTDTDALRGFLKKVFGS